MLARLSRFLCVAGSLLFASTAFAQQASAPELVTQTVNDTQRVTLPGTVSPSLAKATDLGSLATSKTLNRMVLVLKHSDAQEKDLQQLLAAQQQPGSDQYHKWLTPAQFQQRFAPSSADVAKVTAWLQSKGFTGVTVSPSGHRVEFSGPVASVESAFGTKMHQFSVTTATGVEKHVANATAVSIPQALSPVVAGVVSLNDFVAKPLHSKEILARRSTSAKPDQAKPQMTSTDGYGDFSFYLAPSDLRTIYGANSLPVSSDGSGVSISVIGRSNILLSDIESFRTMFSLPQNDPNIIISGPDPGNGFSNDLVESSLDVEWAGAIAKNAKINFVIASSTDITDGIALASAYAIENVVSPILTLSYGSCEQHNGPGGNLFWSSLWQQAAAEGISVFVSSGDGGAAGCDADEGNSPAVLGDSVNALASTPYTVAVGGTEFAENQNYFQFWSPNNNTDLSSALGYIPESTWNDSCDPSLPTGQGNCYFGQTYTMAAGGGGGRSNCATSTQDSSGNVTCIAGYPKPSWQQGPGVPADGVRDVPDVALSSSGANDPYVICVLGSCEYTQIGGQTSITQVGLVGGTSAASPTMASIMALVEQKNGTYVGLPNATLYNLAAKQGNACDASTRQDPTQTSSCIFNDITSGSNSVPGLPGWGTPTADFTSTAGYDLASGLGSVNIANLVNNWASATNSTATATKLTATVTSAKHGAAIPLSVAVTSATGTPSGDIVLLTDKYGAGDQYTLAADGTWSASVSDLPGGTYTLTARYGGDNTHAASTSTGTTLTISPENSTAAITPTIVDNNTGLLVPVTTPNYLGYPIYFKGYIAGVSGQGLPTGTVNVLMDGTTNLGSTSLTADGGYLIESTAAPVGTHAITVQYAGDNSFNPVTSAPVSLTVGKGESYSQVLTGNSILAVYLAGSGSAPLTGTAQVFVDDVAVNAPMPVVYSGVLGTTTAQINVPYTFTAGVHTIYALYSGDKNYQGTSLADGSANEQTLHIGANGSTPSAISFTMTTKSPLPQGQIANFIYKITSLDKKVTTPPTGYITANILGTQGFVCNALISASNNGSIAAGCSLNGAGEYTLQASYSGDSTYAPSLSTNTITLSVPKITAPQTVTASAAYTLPNTQITLATTLSAVTLNAFVQQVPTGTVTFMDAVNGATPVSLGTFYLTPINNPLVGYSQRATLPAGTNVITAIYSGDVNFNTSSMTTTVVVGVPDFTFTGSQGGLSIAAGSTGSTTLSLTPTLNYTGTVALACGSGLPAGSTCAVTPASASLATAQTATVTVTTLAPSPTVTATSNTATLGRSLQVTSIAGLLLILLSPKTRRRIPGLLALLLVGISVSLSGCGNSTPTPEKTLLTLSSSAIKAASGTSVTVTANLNGLANSSSGTITFYDGKTALGSPTTISVGTATMTTSSLAVGGHILTAVYSGDANNSASTSSALTQVITGTTTLQMTATSGSLVHTISIPVTLN